MDDDMDIVDELRAVAAEAAKAIDPLCVYARSSARAADEIVRLRNLLNAQEQGTR